MGALQKFKLLRINDPIVGCTLTNWHLSGDTTRQPLYTQDTWQLVNPCTQLYLHHTHLKTGSSSAQERIMRKKGRGPSLPLWWLQGTKPVWMFQITSWGEWGLNWFQYKQKCTKLLSSHFEIDLASSANTWLYYTLQQLVQFNKLSLCFCTILYGLMCIIEPQRKGHLWCSPDSLPANLYCFLHNMKWLEVSLCYIRVIKTVPSAQALS